MIQLNLDSSAAGLGLISGSDDLHDVDLYARLSNVQGHHDAQ